MASNFNENVEYKLQIKEEVMKASSKETGSDSTGFMCENEISWSDMEIISN